MVTLMIVGAPPKAEVECRHAAATSRPVGGELSASFKVCRRLTPHHRRRRDNRRHLQARGRQACFSQATGQRLVTVNSARPELPCGYASPWGQLCCLIAPFLQGACLLGPSGRCLGCCSLSGPLLAGGASARCLCLRSLFWASARCRCFSSFSRLLPGRISDAAFSKPIGFSSFVSESPCFCFEIFQADSCTFNGSTLVPARLDGWIPQFRPWMVFLSAGSASKHNFTI